MDNGASSYRRFLDGDDSGMVELIRDYKDGLLLYLNSYTNNYSIAEDCVQDTFIKLAVKKPKFREKSSFKTWLYTIGRNVMMSHMRKAARRNDVLIDDCYNISAETDLEKELRMIDVNVTAVHILTKLFLRDMMGRGRGVILNVGKSRWKISFTMHADH